MDRIGEYLVRRLIGEGGMGKVYEAEERLSKRRVALKVLRPELTRHEEGRRLFLNEMQILAHLEHPNLVRSLASIETDGQLVMVLEYLQGRTLRQELTRRGCLPWQEAIEHVACIAEALTVAHDQEPSIVHRDLKPENVMLTVGDGAPQDGAPTGLKVMDFGIAKVLEAMRQGTTHSVGTLQYMSPEQIDAGDVGPRADLYALGLVFYELLCGQPPFTSASPRELLNLHCTAPVPPLPDHVRRGLPKGVERLVQQLLSKRADERPASADAVVEALEPFAASQLDLGTMRVYETERAPSAPRVDTRPSPGQTDVPSTPAVRPVPIAADTIGLIERASGPRQIPAGWAMAIVVGLSVLAGVATWLYRSGAASGAEPASSAVTAVTRPVR